MTIVLATVSQGPNNKIINMKVVLVMLVLMLTNVYCDGQTALRRKPKVYNALITTDEDLEQSRAYPVIQPTIHESGIAHYPYSPLGVYNPHVVRVAQPIVPVLTSNEQLSYPLPNPQISPQVIRQPLMPQPLAGYPLPQNPPTAPASEQLQATSVPPTGLEEQQQPMVQPPALAMQTIPPQLPKDDNQIRKMPMEQLPIPLNQYGLPPALIPFNNPQLHQPQPYPSGNGLQPFHLHPYRFNPIPPVYYNPMTGYRQQFLPPYSYLPTGPQFPLSNTIPTDKNYPQPPNQNLPTPTVAIPNPPPTPPVTMPPLTTPAEITTSSVPSTELPMTDTAFENIKNGSKSQDSNVVDVPPPPIPSGAKPKQS